MCPHAANTSDDVAADGALSESGGTTSMEQSPFDQPGRFNRGNPHTNSDRSDDGDGQGG
jgi:hypothetical protein